MEVRAGYKQTEVGVIPEEWDVRTFGRNYAESSRNGIYKSAEFQGRGTRIVNMGEMFGFDFISDQEMNRVALTSREMSMTGLCDGDLLFGRRSVVPAGAGKCSLVVEPSEPLTFESSIIRVRLNQADANPLFYYYFFSSSTGRDVMSIIVSGTNVKGIRGSELRELKIPHPPLPEQRAIAVALNDVDALLGGLYQVIAKKRDLKQAAMQQLLTGQTRLPGFTGDWEVKRLGDHVTFLRNGVNSRAELRPEGRVRYLHYGDIHASTGSFISPKALPSLPDAKAARLDRLRDGDVIFADASEDIAGVCKSVELCNTLDAEVVPGLHTIAARFDKGVLADGFKGYLQFCPSFAAHLRRLAAGTKVFATNRAHIASVEMKLPGVAEQEAITSVLSDMDTELVALERRREKIRALKQGMMQELLTGKTRLVSPPGGVV
ncbi:restriction endonuclease subunit S [Geothrix terrae]|uniref:restriction endonuclease subunit S n=1 Tax=Geothrix terrae TaxID=2922720 RepID=UPI001FABFDC7|nr:restriction endonuclease subunit S [Geothrix terrae]